MRGSSSFVTCYDEANIEIEECWKLRELLAVSKNNLAMWKQEINKLYIVPATPG